uniref:Uncharacterized protein n=1 Tax=Aegilops tauschii subsp. strangulata TaxID=200361 RepID=A0A452Y6W1_AEGTS
LVDVFVIEFNGPNLPCRWIALSLRGLFDSCTTVFAGLVASAELRPAAAVQAVRQPLRGARWRPRDRQRAGGQRQDRPAGHN